MHNAIRSAASAGCSAEATCCLGRILFALDTTDLTAPRHIDTQHQDLR